MPRPVASREKGGEELGKKRKGRGRWQGQNGLVMTSVTGGRLAPCGLAMARVLGPKGGLQDWPDGEFRGEEVG